MLQAPRSIVFISILAIICSLAIPEETSNSMVSARSQNTSVDDVTARATVKFITTSAHYENERTENSSETLTERSSNEMVTSLENKRKKEGHTDCHLAEETKDMLNCFFLTDDATIRSAEKNASRNTSDEIGQKALKYNDTYPPKIFPQDKDVKSINSADEATRRRLNHTFYTIVTPRKIVDGSSVEDRADNEVRNTIATISPASKTNNIQDTSFRNDSEIASQKFTNNEGMSGGMVALTMMLTFVITIAIIYASVIAYKRYLDYRCNRRQLLDNDSEFDANDLHHFEL